MATTPNTATDIGIEYPNGIAAAKAHAKVVGVAGRKGGWLYSAKGTPICQGWASYTGRLVRHGVIVDTDGQTLATREGDVLNGRLRRNVFAGAPVLLRSAVAS